MGNAVIYSAVDDTLPNREGGEESEKILMGDRPELGDTLSMGTDREWRVMRVEAYKCDGKTVYVATVVPDRAENITAVPVRLEYPSMAFSVMLSPEQKIITYAWEMQGMVPCGRLEGYNFDDDGGITPFPLNWVIDRVETYQPDEDCSTFARLHLCWCKEDLSQHAIAS